MLGHGTASIASLGFAVAIFKGWIPFLKDGGIVSYVLLTVLSLTVFAYSFSESRINLFHRITGLQRAWLPVYVSRMSISDIVSVILLMLLKYVLKPVGLVSKAQPAADGLHFKLPELHLAASLKIDVSDEFRYDAATKLQSTASKPPSLKKPAQAHRLMLLPAITTPMMLTLTANRYCPVLPFGSVNTKNRFEFLDPAACRDPVQLLDLSKTVVDGRLGGDRLLGRRVKRGMELDIEVEIRAPRKGSTEIKPVFKQVITILQFIPASTQPKHKGSPTAENELVLNWSKQPSSAISFTGSEPGKWAALCSDYNPIHVSSSMAKLFGFPARIAHGNHVVAGVIQELVETELPGNAERGLRVLLSSDQPSFLEVQFKRPMVLPIEMAVHFGMTGDLKRYAFSADKGEKRYITGQAGLLAE